MNGLYQIMPNVDPIWCGLASEPRRIAMTHAFILWFGRFLSSAHPASRSEPREPEPMKIEVEALPDYLWRELGFQQPRRRLE
jgi:hypothetical protein